MVSCEEGKSLMDDRRIRELRNLGPACERDLNAVGIYTLADILDRGVEATFLQLMQGKPKRKKGGKIFHATYLCALYGAVHDLDWRDIPESKKEYFKRLTAQLRREIA